MNRGAVAAIIGALAVGAIAILAAMSREGPDPSEPDSGVSSEREERRNDDRERRQERGNDAASRIEMDEPRKDELRTRVRRCELLS